MKVTNYVLKDFDDQPLVDTNKVPMTLGGVLRDCAMIDVAPGAPRRTAKEIVTRADVALTFHKLKIGESAEVTVDVAKMLIDDALRLFPPVTSLHVLKALDPGLFEKVTH
jgi:hypothetical protein